MTALEVRNIKGEKVGEVEIPDTMVELAGSEGMVHEVIRMHQSGRRRGTASTKNRSEVAASGRKPWRQKGTGRARSGSRSNPIWRGGGVIFGPRPRSFDFKVPKKVKRKALKSILSIRFRKEQVVVVDELELEEPRTGLLVAILSRLKIEGSAIIVTPRLDRKIHLASRNIPGVTAAGIRDLNTYLVASHGRILITREALGHLQAWMETVS